MKLLTSTDSYMMHSAELGWTVRPSARAGIYRANAAGLRAGRAYEPRPAPGIKDRGPEYDPGWEGFKVLVRLLDAFSAEVRRDKRIVAEAVVARLREIGSSGTAP